MHYDHRSNKNNSKKSTGDARGSASVRNGGESVVLMAAYRLPRSDLRNPGMEHNRGTCHRPPKTDFEKEKYIIILYSFCTILYTESQILYTIPSCAIGNSNLGR